jgi:hypothetical protein
MEGTTVDWISIIVQSGAVGIAVMLILSRYKADKMYNRTMNNHLEHYTEAQKEETNAKIKLAEALTGLIDTIKGCRHNKLNK